jgi:GAF domain-containing protein/HAMP domain-containing protein
MRSKRSIRPWRFSFTLRSRLITGYLIVLGLFGLLAVVTGYQITQVAAANHQLEQQTLQALAVEELSRASLELVVAIDEAILLKDPAYFTSRVPAAVQAMEERHAQVRAQVGDTAPLDFTIASLMGYINPMRIQSEQGTWDVIQRNRTTRMGDNMVRLSNEIDKLLQATEARQVIAVAQAQQAQTSMMRFLALSLALAIAASALTVFANIRSLTRQVRNLSQSANRLAAGQLGERARVESEDELGQLAEAFNAMAGELQSLYGSFEAQIADRTRDLEHMTAQMRASTEVARAAAMVLDPQELQTLVVNLISDRFNFYHTGIFLLDEAQVQLTLTAASSTGGQTMLARRHSLKVGQGVVGFAAQQGEAHIAQDVGADAVFFNNLDLPQTRSEVALPLRARGRTIGVLDVQSQKAAAFTPENVAIFQSLADQVGLALDNARLYQESQQRLAEVRRLYGEYGQQAWEGIIQEHADIMYRYTPLRGVEADHQAANVEHQASGGVVALPLRIREQEIGRMQVRKPVEAGPWTESEIEILNTLLEQLGVALEGARLFQETQRRAERERMIGAVTAQIRETLDVETVLRTAAQEIYEALGLQAVMIRLEDPDQA